MVAFRSGVKSTVILLREWQSLLSGPAVPGRRGVAAVPRVVIAEVAALAHRLEVGRLDAERVAVAWAARPVEVGGRQNDKAAGVGPGRVMALDAAARRHPDQAAASTGAVVSGGAWHAAAAVSARKMRRVEPALSRALAPTAGALEDGGAHLRPGLRIGVPPPLGHGQP